MCLLWLCDTLLTERDKTSWWTLSYLSHSPGRRQHFFEEACCSSPRLFLSFSMKESARPCEEEINMRFANTHAHITIKNHRKRNWIEPELKQYNITALSSIFQVETQHFQNTTLSCLMALILQKLRTSVQARISDVHISMERKKTPKFWVGKQIQRKVLMPSTVLPIKTNERSSHSTSCWSVTFKFMTIIIIPSESTCGMQLIIRQGQQYFPMFLLKVNRIVMTTLSRFY